eukprot:TRINITY_DN27479_c0_g1_i1.p1 TRINITY_DN27479_c0_g1~~TRINITY_DN27479_c0_g1_i1.p1  ORF type:complete len:729 (-),score=105.16 TRINITY_DN27479_c0_g1_i1:149-2335(-)
MASVSPGRVQDESSEATANRKGNNGSGGKRSSAPQNMVPKRSASAPMSAAASVAGSSETESSNGGTIRNPSPSPSKSKPTSKHVPKGVGLASAEPKAAAKTAKVPSLASLEETTAADVTPCTSGRTEVLSIDVLRFELKRFGEETLHAKMVELMEDALRRVVQPQATHLLSSRSGGATLGGDAGADNAHIIGAGTFGSESAQSETVVGRPERKLGFDHPPISRSSSNGSVTSDGLNTRRKSYIAKPGSRSRENEELAPPPSPGCGPSNVRFSLRSPSLELVTEAGQEFNSQTSQENGVLSDEDNSGKVYEPLLEEVLDGTCHHADWITVAVQSEKFDYMVACVIILSAISAGIQADYMARNWTFNTPTGFTYLNLTVCLFSLVELCLRCYAYGTSFSTYVSRNLLDCCAIVANLVDVTLEYSTTDRNTGFGNGIAVLRVVRIMRMIRIIRTAHLLHMVGDLRILMVSILDSTRPFFYSVGLICLLSYTFAVYLTHLVTIYKMENREIVEAAPLIQHYFGNVGRTGMTLYQATTQGMSWGYFSDALLGGECVFQAGVFIVYVSASILAVMNVVTSVFVTAAMKHAEEDKKKVIMEAMKSFFDEADEDGSGSISWDEFADQLEHPQMQWFLKEVDMHPDQARALFHLLDVEDNGDVEISEIVSGCMRLHGYAKSIDLTILMRDIEHLMKEREREASMLRDHMEFVETSLRSMRKLHLSEVAASRRSQTGM